MCSVCSVLTLDLRQGLGGNSKYRILKNSVSGSVCSVLTLDLRQGLGANSTYRILKNSASGCV